MPDIREVINALDDQDKRTWTLHRTEMRRSYITAHNAVLGCARWDETDDIFLDYIDIKLALLFDRSGRMAQEKDVATKADAKKIETTLDDASDKMKPIGRKTFDRSLAALNKEVPEQQPETSRPPVEETKPEPEKPLPTFEPVEKIEPSEATKSVTGGWGFPKTDNGGTK